MSKDLSIGLLLDFYGQLLTKKQQDMLDLYYNEDLSLGEIAEHSDITRQGVRDSIKRGENRLNEYEQTLGLVQRFADVSEQSAEISEILQTIDFSLLDDDVKNKLEKIQEISEMIRKEL